MCLCFIKSSHTLAIFVYRNLTQTDLHHHTEWHHFPTRTEKNMPSLSSVQPVTPVKNVDKPCAVPSLAVHASPTDVSHVLDSPPQAINVSSRHPSSSTCGDSLILSVDVHESLEQLSGSSASVDSPNSGKELLLHNISQWFTL